MEKALDSILGNAGKLISIVAAIAFTVLWVITPIYTMQKDIALVQQSIRNIETNHEAHIQDLMQQNKEILLELKAVRENDIRQDGILNRK